VTKKAHEKILRKKIKNDFSKRIKQYLINPTPNGILISPENIAMLVFILHLRRQIHCLGVPTGKEPMPVAITHVPLMTTKSFTPIYTFAC